MELFKTILLFLGMGLLGLIGLALLMAILSIPIWGTIWVIGEVGQQFVPQ